MTIKTQSLINVLLIAGFFGYCQSPPVGWSVSSRKLDSQSFRITVKAIPAPDWYIYACADTTSQLTDLSISWDNEEIAKISAVQILDTPEIIRDKIFNKKLIVHRGSLKLTQNIQIKGIIPGNFKIRIQGFASNGTEFQPIDEARQVTLEESLTTANRSGEIRLSSLDLNHPKAGCGGLEKKSKGIWAIFFLGMAGGLIALLTPCVFPMIPVTVSFFTNRAKTKSEGIKNGIFYGASIFQIYLLASLPFHLIGNISPEILNTISTNVWVNLVFFFVFIFFSLSFFGLFEISLPSNIATKTDSKSNLGSLSGIFFMALTLAAVSFSCTGPILGSLLVGSLSAAGGAWQLTAGMAGFGLALALPFGLFAMFPDWLKKLPKSGGWLDTVKKILAFLELALAFKFLSNADLVQHWGILKREVFVGIWILISIGLYIYLYRKRLVILSLIAAFFSVYLVLGFTGLSNLELLSGFPPPHSYSIYKNKSDARLQPDIINDYAGAHDLSKKENKPILIDFTGWACVNCRKMEEQVWTDPAISRLIKKHFILVSLYVDDRKKLAESFSYKTKTGSDKEIITMGDKWATFQSENFSQVTQPMYAIISPDEKLMNLPVGYTPDENKYKQWLECGLQAEKK
jgi:thiol:disulfide interchange protein